MKWLIGIVSLVVLFVAAVWFAPLPTVKHDEARNLPWVLPDYRKASASITELKDGRIQIKIDHLPLKGIKPEMLAWFYKHLPVSTVEFRGNTYPLYHLFHPTEHGRIEVVEPAKDGSKGMGVGALVQRQEWFGEFDSKGAGRIIEFSDKGMTVKPEKFGLHFGLITHEFEETEYGTRYTLKSTIGSTSPIVGTLVNALIQNRMMPAPMLRQWVRHQIEEVASLQFFLPQLYQSAMSSDTGFHYKLIL